MNPFLRNPSASQRTPLRAEVPGAKSAEGGVVTLRLYDPIDSWGESWGISAKEFVNTLDALPDDTSEIRLLINSPGGEVWEGLAILNALRSHKARVVAVVEGIAASSASFIATGVDELIVMQNAEVFIHNAWGMCVGNAADMAKMQSDLSHEDRNIASIYTGKAGGTVDDWLASMASETWYSAEEAVTAGLADRVEAPSRNAGGAAQAKAKFDLSIFDHSGRKNSVPDQIPSADRVEVSSEREEAIMADLNEGLRQRLGITDADADEATILTALDEALAERVEPSTVEASLPEGVVTIDAEQLAALQASARRGDEARAQQERDERARIVDSAVREGRIPPARRDAWMDRLAVDPAEAEVLASLQAVYPVGEPIGHSNVPETNSEISTAELDSFAAQLGLPKGAFDA